MLLLFFSALSRALHSLTGGDSEWLEVLIDCENDAACLCIGLMISLVVRASIVGHMPALHGEPLGKTTAQVWMLLGAASIMGVLVVGLSVVRKSLLTQSTSHELLPGRDEPPTTPPFRSSGSRGVQDASRPSSFATEDFTAAHQRGSSGFGICNPCCGRGGQQRTDYDDGPSWQPANQEAVRDGRRQRHPERELRAQVKRRDPPSLMERGVQMLQLSISLGMGWCLLMWGQWWFWHATDDKGIGAGGVMSARMFISWMFTILVFVAMRIIDRLADDSQGSGYGVSKGLRELLRVFGLLMGLSWEACFVTAVEDISHGHLISIPWIQHEQTFIISGLTLGLGMVVVPAWALYILPRVMEAEEEEENARRGEFEEAYVYPGAAE